MPCLFFAQCINYEWITLSPLSPGMPTPPKQHIIGLWTWLQMPLTQSDIIFKYFLMLSPEKTFMRPPLPSTHTHTHRDPILKSCKKYQFQYCKGFRGEIVPHTVWRSVKHLLWCPNPLTTPVFLLCHSATKWLLSLNCVYYIVSQCLFMKKSIFKWQIFI